MAGESDMTRHHGGPDGRVGDDKILWWMSCQNIGADKVLEVTKCQSYSGHQSCQVLREGEVLEGTKHRD